MATQRNRKTTEPAELAKQVGSVRGVILVLFAVSGVINLLALTGSLYMLQIYDRAIPSASIPTLAALSLLAIGLYLFQGVFDTLRSQILVRLGARVDARLAPLAHQVVIEMTRYGHSAAEAQERGRDVDTLRSFLSGSAPIALFDVPWIPIFLGFVYLLHPWLGLLTIGGALVLCTMTLLTELLTRSSTAKLHKTAVRRNSLVDAHARNADILKAMGIAGHAVSRFGEANAEHLRVQTRTSDIVGTFGALSKVTRMMLQSALLGLGAYLTIKGELSAGSIIACSVSSARALAPVDLAIGNWKLIAAARRSFRRLKHTLAAAEETDKRLILPAPHKTLQVQNMTVVAPGAGAVLVSDVTFEMKAGQVFGLVGPSGGGKTSLAKGLVGVWPLLRGQVRLDGADLDQWRSDILGPQIGYLPQEVCMLEGTIAENIGRFDPHAADAAIVAAAEAAGVHAMITELPEGYQTELGPNGMALSAGQRQRIGLARALYGKPFLVVLDEPNSNLDSDGEAALGDAIDGLKERGAVVIVIAHRPRVLQSVDLVGVVRGGKLAAFGPRDEIIKETSNSIPFRQPARRQAVATI
ncbi:type I secretion protein [Alsobacter metallidurans]|uniref:Type I secretion protein n=1 Tax=Alsobacter metallidurans TaxID=340221 RepID=A0A917I7H0_9HYPH|nr:type I secretion system permease/ATPase [Alsobacter metallidurans]GGH18833.1 type I secretion protein [Alsobacter metallidurans]